jgi:AcrR family transcriptional regulator
MPRTEEANRRIREAQTRKILDAACRVFSHKGVSATMAEVAKGASVSYGLAYRYFPSKKALFRALIEQKLKSDETAPGSLEEAGETPGTQLRSLISRLVETRLRFPELSLMFRQVLSEDDTPSNIRSIARRHGQRTQEALTRLIVDAQRTGEVVETDAEQLVTVVLAFLDGLSSMAVWNRERFLRHFPDAEIILRIFQPRDTARRCSE